MVKTCLSCGHLGELTWRDGKYHCAMCDSIIPEDQPQAAPQSPRISTVNNVTCPICKNSDNNTYDGHNYRCALCGTAFQKEETYADSYYQPYNGSHSRLQEIEDLTKEKKRNTTIGIILLFVFWPAGAYFLWKAYQNEKEIKSLKY